jgi:broad specificity phosphatase PhoE
MRLYIVRHGETDYNRARIMQGYQEIPLNDRGIGQATQLALRLRDERLDRIVCSDLRRAVMTGCIIASYTGVPLEYDPGLRERNPGDLVELPYDDEPRFFTDKIYVPPGGESIAAFFARVKDSFDRLVQSVRHPEERVAVVTHGLVCHAFVAQFLGEGKGASVGSRNASITVVEYHNGMWCIEGLNSVEHLGPEVDALQHESDAPQGA